jgi:hypothetical protein
VAGVIGQTLTPAERQQILRRLKHGPALPKAELAEYASKVRREVLSKRKQVQQ